MVIVGIDGHKQTLACSMVDELGREFDAETFANEPAGHDALLAWVAQSAQSESVEYALESAFSFTRSFCERLGAQGEVVYDVPAKLVERRRRRRGIGKSDVLDAREIARALLREHARMVPLTPISPIVRDLKLLVEHYTQLVRERTQTANRLHADLVRLLPGYQHTIPSFESLKAQKAAARLLRRQHASVHQTIALQRLARISELDKQVTQTKRQLLLLVRASGSGLLELRGVGPISAARILAEVRDVRRFTSADAFARLNGTAPIPASSGKRGHQRLNRGGNRRLNHAIHMIALVQTRCDPRAQAYIAKHRAAGKTQRDAIRCLKRRLSDVIYRQLHADLRNATQLAA